MLIPDQMYINGAFTSGRGEERLEVLDPATEEVIAKVPLATAGDIDDAIDAARRGFEVWRSTDAWTRSATIRRVAVYLREEVEAVAETLTAEQGKPLAEARGEVLAAADQFDWCADEARRLYGRIIDGHSREARILVLTQPVGPVAAFSPWNFPALLPARKLAAAMAAGCSVVLKPAEEAPRTAFFLALACHEAGVPPGVLNVITGRPEEISRQLIASPVIRKVSLTGSVPVGRELARLAAEHIKPITLELGGHSPVLVFPDCDVAGAAEVAARGKFRNMGQVCISASRFYVHEEVKDAFVERFVEVTRSLRIGDGREPGVEVGPLSNRRRLEATEALVADALGAGARLATGGRRPPERSRGYFYEPTVLLEVNPEMRIMTEEPFCPVAPMASFRTLEEAIALANDTDYGLAGYVFTRDTRTAFLAAEGLEVGMVGINHLVIAAAQSPFGGVKASGYGREGGAEGLEAYTITKSVNLKL